jgi:cell division protein FtsN
MNTASYQSQKGQGITEYILMVALVAIFVIGAIKVLSRSTHKSAESPAKNLDPNIQNVANQSSRP